RQFLQAVRGSGTAPQELRGGELGDVECRVDERTLLEAGQSRGTEHAHVCAERAERRLVGGQADNLLAGRDRPPCCRGLPSAEMMDEERQRAGTRKSRAT